jgi:GAF domain-containing protein
VGDEFFRCLVKHVAQAFEAEVAFVAEVIPEDRERARFLACWEGEGLAEPVEYCMAGTPCAEVGRADIVSHVDGVIERFPEDEMVVEMGLDSYLAVAMRGSDGGHLGHLGVLASGPLAPDEARIAALRIFAARAAAEVERHQHERRLVESERAHRALAQELAASRARIVEAGDAERRRRPRRAAHRQPGRPGHHARGGDPAVARGAAGWACWRTPAVRPQAHPHRATPSADGWARRRTPAVRQQGHR